MIGDIQENNSQNAFKTSHFHINSSILYGNEFSSILVRDRTQNNSLCSTKLYHFVVFFIAFNLKWTLTEAFQLHSILYLELVSSYHKHAVDQCIQNISGNTSKVSCF